MPRGDGTGPMGFGPMTGRAAGYCAGYTRPGFMNPIFGFGFGRGGGWGFRRMYRAAGVPGWACFPWFAAVGPDPATEVKLLENQITMMEQSLKAAKERLNELQQGKE